MSAPHVIFWDEWLAATVVQDATVAALALTPSSIDFADYSDSDTETLKLTPQTPDASTIIDDQTAGLNAARAIDGSDTNERIARSFVPTTTARVSTVEIFLARVGSPTDSFRIRICGDIGGVPDLSNTLETQTFLGSNLSLSNVLRSFAFTTTVAAGVTYWLVLDRTGAADNANSYTVGEVFLGSPRSLSYRTSTSAWINDSGKILYKTTYLIQSDVAQFVDTAIDYFCLDVPTTSYYDYFDDGVINANRWQVVTAGVTESGGRFHFDQSNSTARSDATDACTGVFDSVEVKVTNFLNNGNWRLLLGGYNLTDAGVQRTIAAAYLTITGSASPYTITATQFDDTGVTLVGSSLSVTAALPFWLRIRRTYPGLVFEYSTDGSSWTTIKSTVNDYKWMRRSFAWLQTQSALSGVAISEYIFTGTQVDIAQFADSSTESFKLSPSALETAQFVDSNTEPLNLIPTSTDTAQYVETNTETFAFSPSSADVAEFADSSIETVLLSPVSVDISESVDSATELYNLVPSGSDLQENADAGVETFSTIPSGSDILAGVDGETEVLSLTPTVSDVAEFSDSGREDFTFGVSGSELAEFVDTDVEPLLLTPSADEQFGGAAADTATEVFLLQATASDVLETLESDTKLLTLFPAAVEVFGKEDAATEELVFTPIAIEYKEGVDQDIEVIQLTPFNVAALDDSATLNLLLTAPGIEFKILTDLVGRVYTKYRFAIRKIYTFQMIKRWVNG